MAGVGWAQAEKSPEASITSELVKAKVGEPIIFGVTTTTGTGIAANEKVRVKLTLVEANGLDLAAWNPMYYETVGSTGWKDWLKEEGSYLFGPSQTGFPFMTATSYFQFTPTAVGSYKYKLEVVKWNNGKKGDVIEDLTKETTVIVGEANTCPYVQAGTNINYASLYTAVMWADAGSTIRVPAGNFDLKRGTENISDPETKGEWTGWYLPITKPLTIQGAGSDKTILMSSTVSLNNAGDNNQQDFICIFPEATGTVLKDMEIICKTEANKAIHVFGKDFTMTNVVLNPAANENFAGSVYFHSGNEEGSIKLDNVILNKGRIAFSGTNKANVNLQNITIDYRDVVIPKNVIATDNLQDYSPIGSIKDKQGLKFTVDNVTVKLAATQGKYQLDDNTIPNLPANTTVELANGNYTLTKPLILDKSLTLTSSSASSKATFNGYISITAEDVTVKDINLSYERKSSLFSEKNGISVFANKATLTGNTFTTTGDGTNGIVFYPKGNGAVDQKYTVTGNTFNLAGAASTGIIVRENFKSKSQIPGVDATASLSNGSVLDQQIIASESKNTFGNMTGGYYVRVTGDYSVLDGTGNGSKDITQKHIYSYVNDNQAAEAIFYTQNGGYILADDTYTNVVAAANLLDPKAEVPAGITIKCSDAYLVTDANTADKISEAGAQIYILTKEGNTYKATLNATTPTVDTADLEATTIEAGQSLSASILTGGSAKVGDKVISGVFTWKDPTIIAKKGDQTYDVLFTPNDQINYKQVKIPYIIKGIKQYHIITPGKCANGKVVIEGANSANKYEEGSTLSLKAVADANYKFKEWNDKITPSYKVTTKATLTAKFEPIIHQVTIKTEGDGKIAINGKTDHNSSVSVPQGSELNVQAIPTDGKVLESLTCTNGKVISNGIVSVDQAFTISAKFVDKPADKFTVNVQTTENGKILLFDTNGNAITAGSSLAKGTEVSILPVANEGYKLKDQSLKNGGEEITNGKIILSADADIKAEFERQQFAVTTSVANGKIELSGASNWSSVDYGTQVTATVTPTDGYVLLALLVNGKEIPDKGSFTVTAATEVKAVMRELATITIDDTPQTFVYDGKEKAFVVKTIPAGIGGFTVSYSENNPTKAKDHKPKAYNVTIERAADDTYAAFKKTIKDGLIIQAAEWKGIAVPTAANGTIKNATIERVGSFEWDGDVNNEAIHNAIFTPSDENYAKSTFSIPTGKGATQEVSFEWESIKTKATLRSSDKTLTINKQGNGSIIIMNGSTQLTSGNLYVGQQIRLKAIPGANASAKVKWSVNGGSINKTEGDEVILTLAEGANIVTAEFAEKAKPTFPGMDNIGARTYNGSIYGGTTPTVKKDGVSNDWQITFKQNGVIIPSPTNAGTYEIFASRSEDAIYKSVIDKQVGTFTILPKEAVAEVKSVTPVLKGQALAQSVITGTADVDGTFLWDNPENVLTATSNDQAISFVPSNSNYKAKSGLKSQVVVTEATGVTLRTLNLNITNKDNGTVSMSLNGTEVQAGATVTKGDKLTVTFKANTGYTASATINSSPYTSNTAYTIGETDNVEVVVTFTKKSTPDTDPDEPSSQPIAVTGVSLDTTDKTLAINETLILGATVKPSNADNKDVRWSSSDATVASVDQDGKVKALKAGTCTITVTTDDGNFTATCKITVTTATGIDDILAANRVYSQNGQIVIEPMYQPEVWITDLTGRIMYHNRIAEKTQVAASAGIYLVRLSESGKSKTIKVIVK